MRHTLNRDIIEQTIEAISGEDWSEGKQVMFEIMTLYKEKTVGRIAQLQSLFSAKNWEQLHFESHSLKSASGAVGAEAMMELCENIERLSKSGDSPELKNYIDQLSPSWESLREELEACLMDLGHTPG